MSALTSRLRARILSTKGPFSVPKRTVFNTSKFWCRENIPVYGFFIGTAAICFQIGVLYPWHETLSEQIDRLEKATEKVDHLTLHMEDKTDKIIALQEQVKLKERKILDLENTILAKIDQIIESKSDK